MEAAEFKRAVESLRERSTISTITEFLRSKNLAHSANTWDDLIEKRLRQHWKDGKLSEVDFRKLLRDAEDYGHQHIFLYSLKGGGAEAATRLKKTNVQAALKKMGYPDILTTPRFVPTPKQTEMADAYLAENLSLSMKLIERRTLRVEEREETEDGYRIRKRIQYQRAVDLVTFLSTGLLEIRLEMMDDTPDYPKIRDDIWDVIEPIFPQVEFGELDLSEARKKITVNPTDDVRRVVRVRRASGRDTDGTTFTVAAGKVNGNLLATEQNVEGIAKLGGRPTSQMGQTSVGFLAQENGIPRRELGAIFTSAPNEVLILPSCTPEEYEYVRGQIAKLS